MFYKNETSRFSMKGSPLIFHYIEKYSGTTARFDRTNADIFPDALNLKRINIY